MSPPRFEPGPALAMVSATPIGWIIEIRGPYSARHYDFKTEGDAAEMAIVLRDQGGWALRFSPAAEVVRRLVEDLGDGGAHA